MIRPISSADAMIHELDREFSHVEEFLNELLKTHGLGMEPHLEAMLQSITGTSKDRKMPELPEELIKDAMRAQAHLLGAKMLILMYLNGL